MSPIWEIVYIALHGDVKFSRGKYSALYILFHQNSFPRSSLRQNPRWRLPTLWSLWIGLPPSWIRDVGGPWARVRPIPNQIIGALTCTLKDSYPTKRSDYVAETWRELFRFITATVMRGLRKENTTTRDLTVRDPVDRESIEKKTEILL